MLSRLFKQKRSTAQSRRAQAATKSIATSEWRVGMLSAGEVAHLDYAQWKNLSRWIATMKARPTWDQVNEGFYTYFVVPYKDATFEGLRG